MAKEDESSAPTGSANPRRGERRESPVIEGAAHEIGTGSESGAPSDGAAPEHTAPPPESPRASGLAQRAPAFVAAAFILSILAFAAAGLVAWRTYARGEEVAALNSKIAQLRRRLADVETTSAQVGAIGKRLDAIGGDLKSARARASQALAAAKQSAKEAAAANPASQQAAMAAMQKQIAALQARPDPTALEAKIVQQGAAEDRRIAAAGQRAGALQKTVDGLSGELAAQSVRLKPLEALLKAPKIDAAALEASNAKAVRQANASARVVVARMLVDKIDSGQPFTDEIAAIRELGGDPAAIGKLAPLAAAGAPTAQSLKASFEPLVGPILAGVQPKAASGVLGRLASGLGKLVMIRTVGQGSGGDPASLVGRIEGDLAHGDVSAALQARDRLPAQDKTLTAEWAGHAQTKVKADQAASALLAGAVAELAKTGA